MSYVLRFINNLKLKEPKLSGRLSVSELQASELFLIKIIQAQSFCKELIELKQKTVSNKQILKLNPFLDNNKLIRVEGRLRHADFLSSHQKCPPYCSVKITLFNFF